MEEREEVKVVILEESHFAGWHRMATSIAFMRQNTILHTQAS